MHKISKNEKGFSVVEALLVILIVAVIGFGGYYVWHTQHKTTKPAATPSTSSKKSASSIGNNTPTQKTSDSAIIQIPELGIELTVPNTLSDITYHYSTNDPVGNTSVSGETFADLSTSTLDSLDAGCVANSSSDTAQGTALGMLVKASGQGKAGEDFTVVKQFSTYYIGYANPQAPCANNSSNDSEVEAQLGAFITALPNITVTAIN